MAHGIPARLTAAEGRRFALTVGGAFLVLAAVLRWRDHASASWLALVLAGALLLAALMVPGRLGPIYRGWMRFGLLLSKITTPVFMAVVYFLVLTPIGLLRRLLATNPLVDGGRENGSHWTTLVKGRSASMERQF